MLLSPKYKKPRKSFIRNSKKTSKKPDQKLTFGTIGLVGLEAGRINSRQLEAARKVIRRSLKKEAKTWTVVFPQSPVTKKPQEVRMGKGKGNIKNWVVIAKKGSILYEIKGITQSSVEKAVQAVKKKISIKTTILKKKFT